MKTQLILKQKETFRTFSLLMAFAFGLFAFTSVQAQSNSSANSTQNERTIKGVIKSETGPLESASIILKGTNTGTTSDKNGEFKFPQPLKTGDILLVSYLGFETQEVKIKENMSFLNIVLTEDLLEFVGALNSDKPYKSKRSN